MRVISRNHLFLFCAMSVGASNVLADDRPQPPNAPQRKPPEAAFSACNDLRQDDVCEVVQGDRTIQGKCVPARDEARLLCLGDDPPAPPDARKPVTNAPRGKTGPVRTSS